jgi:hypothetical protein
VVWRRWVSPMLGVTLGVEGYSSSAYNRTGATVGVMHRLARRTTRSR